MDDRERAQRSRATFDRSASGFDHPALRLFALTGQAMAEGASLTGHEQILDVAAGTGSTTIPFAHRVPRGKVTAIDISPAMLAITAERAEAAGLSTILTGGVVTGTEDRVSLDR